MNLHPQERLRLALCALVLSVLLPQSVCAAPPPPLVDFGATWGLLEHKSDEPAPPALADQRRLLSGWERVGAPLSSMPPRGGEDTSLYWVHDFDGTSHCSPASLLVEVTFRGSFVVTLNGRELLRHGLPLEGTPSPEALDPDRTWVVDHTGPISRRAFPGLDPTALRSGPNTLLVQLLPVGNDHHFDLRLTPMCEPRFVRGPYVQNVQEDRATIVFETSLIATPFVEYGTADDGLSHLATTPAVGAARHEILIEGLQPDTRYFYRALAEPTWPPTHTEVLPSDIFYFRTSPTTDQEFSFVAYGDNRSNPKVHRALVERMMKHEPRFALNTGDLTLTGDDYWRWLREFFDPASDLMHYVPLYPTPGNHDGHHISYFDAFVLPGNEAWFQQSFGDVEVFALDTEGVIRADSHQVRWLETALSRSSAPWKIVMFHKPAFSCTPKRMPGNAAIRNHVLPLLVEHHVDLVLAGHDHLYAHGVYEGIHFVITGGGGASTYPVQVEAPNSVCEQIHHYCVVDVSPKALAFRAIDKNGGLIESFEIGK